MILPYIWLLYSFTTNDIKMLEDIWAKITGNNFMDALEKYIQGIKVQVKTELQLFKTEIYDIVINKYKQGFNNKLVKFRIEKYVSNMEVQFLGHSYKKIEVNDKQKLVLDRLNPIATSNILYGQLDTEVLEQDGDKLDYLAYIPRPFTADFFTGCNIIKVYPLFAINYIDDNCRDLKVVVIPVDLVPHIVPSYDMFVQDVVSYISDQIIKITLCKSSTTNSVSRVTGLVGFQQISKYISEIKNK